MVPHLKHLFISKVRVKLLETFLTHPEELFYVRQLVRRTNEEINAIRRELSNMESSGLVSKESRGNRLYYWIRKDYLFYPELIGMITKTTGLGKEILAQRNKLGKINHVAFSYRFAQHLEPKTDDEIDILVIGEIVIPEITAIVQQEEIKRKREINFTVMNDQELKTRKAGKDPFLLNILSQPKIMLIGDEEKLLG